MLRYIQYQTSQDFFDQASQFVERPLVVCPNPFKADEARLRFDSVGKEVECITISKFMKDQIKSLLPEETMANAKNKSELILFLGAVWKKLKTNPDYLAFVNAFNIFTELRSYSVETPVIEGALEFYDEELAQIVTLFQKLVTDMGIIDEHGSYNVLTQRLREGDLPVEYNLPKEIVLYGFEFLTASQLDLLKILATRTDLSLLLYQNVVENSTDLDWVGWLKPEETIQVEARYEMQKTNNSFEFSPGYLAHSIRDESDIYVLGTKKSEFQNIQELPFNSQYKQSVDIFSQSYQMVWEWIGDFSGKLTDLREELKDLGEILVKREDFLGLKVCLLVINKINHWEGLSDSNGKISQFDLSIIKDSTELDLPRINKFNPRGNKEITALSQIEGIKDKKVSVIISTQYQRLSFSESMYTDSIEKYLTAIGPIRRAEFEYNIYLSRLIELNLLNDLDFYIEQGLLKADKQWKRILDHFEFESEKLPLKLDRKTKYVQHEKKSFELKRLSSSKLQMFSDCPRKFYYSYIEKISPDIKLQGEVDAAERGQIQHEVIEVYLKSYPTFDEDSFQKTIEKVVAKYLSGKDEMDLDGLYVEVRAYTLSIIQILLTIKNQYNVKFEFEKEFFFKTDIEFTGSIDCFGRGANDLQILLDFKRSGYSFSTITEILEFGKNQLWFYLKRLVDSGQLDLDKPMIFGYVDLSDVSNSLLFSPSREYLTEFKEIFGRSRSSNIEDVKAHMDAYSEFEAENIERLKGEKEFNPQPIDHKVCSFCFLATTCSRGVLHG